MMIPFSHVTTIPRLSCYPPAAICTPSSTTRFKRDQIPAILLEHVCYHLTLMETALLKQLLVGFTMPFSYVFI
jgi:predicted SAM-dependent methyltransferase